MAYDETQIAWITLSSCHQLGLSSISLPTLDLVSLEPAEGKGHLRDEFLIVSNKYLTQAIDTRFRTHSKPSAKTSNPCQI